MCEYMCVLPMVFTPLSGEIVVAGGGFGASTDGWDAFSFRRPK